MTKSGNTGPVMAAEMIGKWRPSGRDIRVGATVCVGKCPDIGTVTARADVCTCDKPCPSGWFISFNGEEADPFAYRSDFMVVVEAVA